MSPTADPESAHIDHTETLMRTDEVKLPSDQPSHSQGLVRDAEVLHKCRVAEGVR